MKRKLLSILLAVILVLTCLPHIAAETLSGTCGDNLTWTFHSDTAELVISGTGAMYGYEQGKQPWYNCDFDLIVIEDGVTAIGRYAFAGCCATATVIIPKSVTSIGYFSFGGYPRCVVVDSPTIAKAAVSYDAVGYLFFHNTTVLVNKQFTTVGGYISSNRTNETTVLFREQEYTAYSKDTTHSYVAAVRHSYNGFSCSSCGAVADLRQVWDASATATDVVTATLTPDIDDTSTLTFSGNGAMADYSSMVKVPWQHYYPTVDEVVFEKGITNISANGFVYFPHLTSLFLPEGVQSIGEEAFSRCENLTAITIPSSVTAIGNYAFHGCASLAIYGYTGSYAETYATENNIPFIALLRGDFVDDGVLSSADAVYLLYHTMLPEKYPIGESGDINGDGQTDSEDAICLLYHALLPEQYPL